ncbi:MAG: FAD-dependent oxidoreductase [Streptosporangiaceae bacterium]
MRVLEVAVIGSGPAGLYTAEALVKHAAALEGPDGPVRVRVDVYDRLPTPYGLVRYGVAPDHKSIKSIAEYLRKVLESPDVRFLGGVHLGQDVTREDLLSAYDAVVYATGAMRDRRLGIPGEDLAGSYAATDFVNWYCGHPDVGPATFTLDAESVAVIGVGNVAVDVARILARDPADLRSTDVPQPVLEALQASKVRAVHMIGRRGPAHAKFTTKELRELGELPGVEVIVPGAEADPDAFDSAGQGASLAESDRRVRGNMVVIRKWAAGERAHGAAAGEDARTAGGPQDGPQRTLTIRFWLRPVEITGTEGVTGVVLERTRLDEDGAFQGTGELETLDAQLVLRSVGYQSVPLDGVPFDERNAVVPNAAGRVLGPDGRPLPGEYVAGWLKRGPTGVIGTNKSDAAETVRSLLSDLAGAPAGEDAPLPRPGVLRYPDATAPPPGSRVQALEQALARRGIRPVTYDVWLRVEEAEAELARSLGRGQRVKLHGREALLAACWPVREESVPDESADDEDVRGSLSR